jgi:hypothetical protein
VPGNAANKLYSRFSRTFFRQVSSSTVYKNFQPVLQSCIYFHYLCPKVIDSLCYFGRICFAFSNCFRSFAKCKCSFVERNTIRLNKILHTCRLLFDPVESGKFKEIENNRSGRFVLFQGHRLFSLILISGLPEPNRKNKKERVLCPFFFTYSSAQPAKLKTVSSRH